MHSALVLCLIRRKSDTKRHMDRLPSILGMVFAVAVGAIAVSQVSSLRDLGAPLTSGSMRALLDTTWFFMLMLVVVVALGALFAAVMLALKGR